MSEDQVDADLASVNGFDSFWSFSKDRKGYSGVVTYSAKPPLHVWEGIGDSRFDQEGRCVVTDHGSFILYNVYFPNAGRGPERLKFKLDFYDCIESKAREWFKKGRQVIIVGDLNTCHKEIDIWDPVGSSSRTGFLPCERAWMDRIIKSCSPTSAPKIQAPLSPPQSSETEELNSDVGEQQFFVDTYRSANPEKIGAYTWWDPKSGSRQVNRGWRLDYILCTSGLSDALTRVDILSQQMGSDHCPVLAEFDDSKIGYREVPVGVGSLSSPLCAKIFPHLVKAAKEKSSQKSISSFFAKKTTTSTPLPTPPLNTPLPTSAASLVTSQPLPSSGKIENEKSPPLPEKTAGGESILGDLQAVSPAKSEEQSQKPPLQPKMMTLSGGRLTFGGQQAPPQQADSTTKKRSGGTDANRAAKKKPKV